MIPKYLIPLLMGLAVVIVVVAAIALFGGSLIDFFRGFAGVAEKPGTETGQTSGSIKEIAPPTDEGIKKAEGICSYCSAPFSLRSSICYKEECEIELSKQVEQFSMQCVFVEKGLFDGCIATLLVSGGAH